MTIKEKLILGIETSCDDTSISLVRGAIDSDGRSCAEVLVHNKFSQEILLKRWGGIVPEIAARNHLAKLAPLLQDCFEQASITPSQVDAIGVTTHPGLLGPLLTGLNAAKTLSLLHQKPLVSVNHLYAHLEAIHLTDEVSYPYLGLLVSGGHSIFFLVESVTSFKILGGTIDDAAGEAFDKGGKLLGLGYPAGVIIDRYASWGDQNKYAFPIGMKQDTTPTMSFSGVKTAARVFKEKNADKFKESYPEFFEKDPNEQFLYDVCASYQKAIVDALSLKLKRAKELIDMDLPIVVGGGVACNSALRREIKMKHKNVHFVKPEFCTDNGAMIANYALRNLANAVAFPDCLELDARGRFIQKTKMPKGSK
jgi:N6-L-threonylcarbamoyladenine synthase